MNPAKQLLRTQAVIIVEYGVKIMKEV